MFIGFDARGREIPDDIPVAFTVPVDKRISTLDFHRQRLLEQRELLRRMMEEVREESGYETFAEANDFAVEDPFDDALAERTDFELDDDVSDGVTAVAERLLRENLAENSGAGKKTVASTEPASRPESQA